MIRVTDEAFPYLVVQQGRLDDLKHDRVAWEFAYRAALEATFEGIKRFLPERCENILDVGGGMGGIDVLLARHYGGKPAVWLLDGYDAPPVVASHAKPFSNFEVARDFLAANGVEQVTAIRPEDAVDWPAPKAAPATFDLVVSFASWCFHYPPETYLEFVAGSCRRGARVIVDLRNRQAQWAFALDRRFRALGRAATETKLARQAYAAR